MKEENISQTEKDIFKSFIFDTSKNSGISFDDDYQFDFSRKNILSGLKNINIFVGANNSGKSRILRAIFKQTELMFEPLANDFLKYFFGLKTLITNSRIAPGQFTHTVNFLSKYNDLASNNYWVIDSRTSNPNILRLFNESYDEIRNRINNNNVFLINNEGDFPAQIIKFLDEHLPLKETLNNLPKVHQLYIPTLRGMRTLGDLNSDLYGDRTKKDYFDQIKEDGSQKISSGLDIYSDIKKKLLGSHIDRRFIKEYESFLSENFFDNIELTLVPREKNSRGEDNDVVHITFENNEKTERAIYEFGDGIQSIICITYTLFSWLSLHENKKGEYLLACIEEPEMYLHPSMQRKLVEVLMNDRFRQIQFFITTHSNHFLDLLFEPEYIENISIFSVLLTDNGIKKVKKEVDLSSSVYGLLGAKPSSLLLPNKTIWVEGITDRMYIRQGIKLYLNNKGGKHKKPSEDLDYAFIEYGGSNLAHYLEDNEDLSIESISNCQNVFMLVDDDGVKVGEKKSERYKSLKKKLESSGGIFSKTSGREIENYIRPEILRIVYPNLAEDLSHEDYINESLPKYLFLKNCSLYLNGGIFSSKLLFAEKIIDEQKEWSDLSKEMQNMIKKIINFISKY